jgi:glycosyltransferase involved in cell wall biosynthesis
MTARLTINGRFLTRSMTGVDRFAVEVLRLWLPSYGARHSARIVIPSNARLVCTPGSGPDAVRVGSLNGHGWEQFELPLYCRGDMLLNLCNTGPIAHGSQLCVLHDAAVMSDAATYSFAFRTWYRCLMAGLMRRAQVVATVSKFSASELTRYFGARKSALEVVYESGEHILRASADPGILKRLDLVGKKYILAVGSRARNKNLMGAVRAAALLGDLGVKLVVAGGSNSRVFEDVSLDSPDLILAGYVSDGELRALYENAQCFVFPSLYEGFGLPPLEAMHCGCPVVVSNRAALPEVCGDAVLYCNPEDPADIARQLRRVLSTGTLREELRDMGFARAKLFSWRAASEQLEHLLTQ